VETVPKRNHSWVRAVLFLEADGREKLPGNQRLYFVIKYPYGLHFAPYKENTS
jgi:hypothetical protein